MTRPPRGSRPSRGSRVSRPSRGSRPSWGPPRPLGPPGQSFHSAAIHGDTPRDVEMGPALAGLLGSPALPDSRSISIPGIPTLPGAQPSLSGVRPTPGFTGTPRGPGNFHGRGNCQPSGRHHPSTVNDVALSGHSALPGLSRASRPSRASHLTRPYMGIPLWRVSGPPGAASGTAHRRSYRPNQNDRRVHGHPRLP